MKGGSIWSAIYFKYGISGFYSTNSSYNDIACEPTYQCVYPISEFVSNYSSACHNHLTDSLVASYDSEIHKVYCCNFVDNPKSQNNYWMIQISNYLGANESIVRFNNCAFISPYGGPKIFGSDGNKGEIIVTFCCFDKISEIGDYAKTENISTNIIIHELQHYSSINCEAVNPLPKDHMHFDIECSNVMFDDGVIISRL